MTQGSVARVITSSLAWDSENGVDKRVSGYFWVFALCSNFSAFSIVLYTWGIIICSTHFRQDLKLVLRIMLGLFLFMVFVVFTVGSAVSSSSIIVVYGAILGTIVLLIIGYAVLSRMLGRLLTQERLASSEQRLLAKKISELYRTGISTAVAEFIIILILLALSVISNVYLSTSSDLSYMLQTFLFVYQLVEFGGVLVLLYSLRRFAQRSYESNWKDGIAASPPSSPSLLIGSSTSSRDTRPISAEFQVTQGPGGLDVISRNPLSTSRIASHRRSVDDGRKNVY